MADDIVVTVEGADTPGEVVPAVEAVASAVLEQAVEIADIIDSARQEGAQEQKEIVYTLNDIHGLLYSVLDEISSLDDRLTALGEQLTSLQSIATAEIVVTETPAVTEKIAETAAVIEEVIAPAEVVVANEPEPRTQKRTRKYI